MFGHLAQCFNAWQPNEGPNASWIVRKFVRFTIFFIKKNWFRNICNKASLKTRKEVYISCACVKIKLPVFDNMRSVYLVASYLQTKGEIGMTLIKGVSQPWKEIKTIF